MSRVTEIQELFGYNRWANRRLLMAADSLDDGQVRRDLGSSFASVLGTFAHIVSSDWIWLRRWSGESPPGPPDEWNLSSLEAVGATWEDVERERSTLLAELDDERLARVVSYRNTRGTPYTSRMDQMLTHVVNHSTYHRGQITTMLRQLGGDTVATDLIAFYREGSSGTTG